MNTKPRLGGTLTALVTPMGNGGSVRLDNLKRNIAFQLEQGVTGLVPTGTTGESPTLTWQEHCVVIQEAIQAAGDRVFVLAGTGSNCTREAITGSKFAIESGAHGVLLAECYYNKPSSGQLRTRYHQPVAQTVLAINPDAVVVPYIIPGRTCCKMEPEDLAILSLQNKNVTAVKEATGDLVNMRRTRTLCGERFIILSGDDNLTATMLTDPEIGANGVISVMSNVAPRAISTMVREFQSGDPRKGWQIHGALEPLFKLVGVHDYDQIKFGDEWCSIEQKYPNPCAVKTMMAGLGMDSGQLREPLGPMNVLAVLQVKEALEAVWKLNPWVLAPIEDFYQVNITERLNSKKIWTELGYS